jgi:RNA polymerase sigma factor for flagellar operon FliA
MSKPYCQPRTLPQPPAAHPSKAEAEHDQQNDLVRLIAWQIFSRVPRHASVEVNDVIQAGYLGLLRARRTYRAECEVPFPIYARYRIRGEILDMLRRLDSAPRSLRRWQRAVETQTRDLSLRLQRLPTDEELSETLGLEIAKVRRNRQMLASAAREHEQSKRVEDDFPHRTRESIADADWMPDAIHERKESFEVLMRSIGKLPPRARKVVVLYYRQNLTMKQIGVLLQVNESRVSQIHKTALQTMSSVLASAGIRPTTRVKSANQNKAPKNGMKIISKVASESSR